MNSSPQFHEAAPTTLSASQLDDLTIVPRQHPWRMFAAVVVLFFIAAGLWNVFTNERFGWPTIFEYLFAVDILKGLLLTIALTVSSMVIGILLGTALAVMRLSPNFVLSGIASIYIWFFRGTPLLVQLIFWFNISALYPVIALSVPFGGPSLELGNANSLITPLFAAFLGLALNESAYMAEIIRSGIGSIDEGQYDAGKALGMSKPLMMARVVLPQAMRIVVPPTGNQVINMLKETSLVSVLAISDLLYSAQIIYAINYKTIPLLIVACIWYLVMTSILTFFQNKLELRYGRGFTNHTRSQKWGFKRKGAAK